MSDGQKNTTEFNKTPVTIGSLSGTLLFLVLPIMVAAVFFGTVLPRRAGASTSSTP